MEHLSPLIYQHPKRGDPEAGGAGGVLSDDRGAAHPDGMVATVLRRVKEATANLMTPTASTTDTHLSYEKQRFQATSAAVPNASSRGVVFATNSSGSSAAAAMVAANTRSTHSPHSPSLDETPKVNSTNIPADYPTTPQEAAKRWLPLLEPIRKVMKQCCIAIQVLGYISIVLLLVSAFFAYYASAYPSAAQGAVFIVGLSLGMTTAFVINGFGNFSHLVFSKGRPKRMLIFVIAVVISAVYMAVQMAYYWSWCTPGSYWRDASESVVIACDDFPGQIITTIVLSATVVAVQISLAICFAVLLRQRTKYGAWFLTEVAQYKKGTHPKLLELDPLLLFLQMAQEKNSELEVLAKATNFDEVYYRLPT
jgi:hypothetical protein